MVRGRQAIAGGASTITVILTTPQKEELSRRSKAMSLNLKRYVSVSEIVRNAVSIYLAADSFFIRDNA